MEPPMLSVRGASKRYRQRTALHPLNLEVPRGVICGLLGHNGAGKSTLIGMLLGQIYADEGEIRIAGHDVIGSRPTALSRVGAIFETPVFHEYLSGAHNLQVLTAYSGGANPARIQEVVRFVGLQSRIDDRVATYSHGMRRRLALAQALLPDPEFLVLDEPGDGLDPEGIHEMRELILRLHRDRGMTILLSSHALAEVQRMCSHVAVLRQGRLLFAGDWRVAHLTRSRLHVAVDRQTEAEKALAAVGLMHDFSADGIGRLAADVSVDTVTRWLVERGFVIHALAPVETSIEDFYLETQRRGEPE